MRLSPLLSGGLAAAAFAFAASLATAAPTPAGGAAFYAPTPPDGMHVGFDFHDRMRLKQELRALHEAAVAQQRADGGTLTEAHKAELDQKLAMLFAEACRVGMAGC
jgi:hypothetical protein